MINVVIYTAGYDTGGQGIRLKQAFDKYYPDEFNVRSIHTTEAYFGFPKDAQHSVSASSALFATADVVHMRNGFENLRRLKPDMRDTGLVVHWHGTRFREEHAHLWPEADDAGAIQLVSTLDLSVLRPGLRWLPSPMNLRYLRAFRDNAPSKASSRIRFCHAPTNREVKSTKLIMDTIQSLANHHVPVELDLIEKKSWQYVLERKAKADVYVDQLRLGYGNNALEAWAMGVPVVAGLVDQRAQVRMHEVLGSPLPFFDTNELDLERDLEAFANDEGLRSHWGLIGLDYVDRFHDDRVVADQLAAIYREAIEMKRGVLSNG